MQEDVQFKNQVTGKAPSPSDFKTIYKLFLCFQSSLIRLFPVSLKHFQDNIICNFLYLSLSCQKHMIFFVIPYFREQVWYQVLGLV